MAAVHWPQKASLLRRLMGWVSAAFLVGALAVLSILGFNAGREEAGIQAEHAEPIKPPSRLSLASHGQPILTIDADAQAAIDLDTVLAASGAYQNRVRAFGTVLDLAALTTLTTNYITAVSELKTAQARLAASQPAYDRAKALYDERIGNLVQVEATEAALIADKATVAAAESKVRTLAATAIQEWGQVIGAGIVNSAPLIMRLIERQNFLIQITVPPGTRLDPPQIASVQMSGKDEYITVQYVSPATRTDPKIQGLSFFYIASAESGVLPGMNVGADLAVGKSIAGYLIPPSAVVWWSGRPWVYLKIAGDKFERSLLPTDMPYGLSGDVVVPVNAFSKPEPAIVRKGAQMLLSEEFRSQIEVEGD